MIEFAKGKLAIALFRDNLAPVRKTAFSFGYSASGHADFCTRSQHLRLAGVGDNVSGVGETDDGSRKWSDRIVVARLADDPQLTEDLLALDQTPSHLPRDVVLDFSSVGYINSSHLARLLKLRKRLVADDGRLMLCCVGTQVWGALMVTGLDKVFQFADDVSTALATLQLAR